MRIRTIKPSFFKDEELAELDPLTRLLFIGLWCMADAEGRLEYRPKFIKSEILPYEECDIEKMLKELGKQRGSNHRFTVIYDVDGRSYIQISNFLKHQRISGKEVQMQSEFPAPPSTVNEKREAFGKQLGSTSELQDAQEGKGREEERKGKERNTRASALALEIPEDLKPFEAEIRDWLDYKKQKGQAYKPKGLDALWRAVRAIPADKRREAVDHSMANNWSGLFQKNGGNGNGHQNAHGRSDQSNRNGASGEPGAFDGIGSTLEL